VPRGKVKHKVKVGLITGREVPEGDFPAECGCIQLGSTTNGTTTLQYTGHINIHDMIYHLFDRHFK
jgi:hypothetical protein